MRRSNRGGSSTPRAAAPKVSGCRWETMTVTSGQRKLMTAQQRRQRELLWNSFASVSLLTGLNLLYSSLMHCTFNPSQWCTISWRLWCIDVVVMHNCTLVCINVPSSAFPGPTCAEGFDGWPAGKDLFCRKHFIVICHDVSTFSYFLMATPTWLSSSHL